MDQQKMTLLIEGLPNEGGRPSLRDFVNTLQNLNSILVGVDKAASPERQVLNEYRIVDLGLSSPARVVIERIPKVPGASSTFRAVLEELRRVSAGDPRGYDYGLVQEINRLATPIGKSLSSVAFILNGHQVTVTPEFKERLAQILKPHFSAYGFIQGRLEMINVHGGANVIGIYPPIGPTKVTGHFPIGLSATVGAALGKNVRAYGRMHYKEDSRYALSITVTSIEVLPPEEELPTFEDLRGIAPDLTGELSTEEWLEKRYKELEPELLARLGSKA